MDNPRRFKPLRFLPMPAQGNKRLEYEGSVLTTEVDSTLGRGTPLHPTRDQTGKLKQRMPFVKETNVDEITPVHSPIETVAAIPENKKEEVKAPAASNNSAANETLAQDPIFPSHTRTKRSRPRAKTF